MFLDNSLQHFGSAAAIPDSFRINDRNRPGDTHAKTIGLGAKDERFRANQTELLQSLLEELPRNHPLLFRTAFGFGLIGAKKDVPLIFIQSQFAGGNFQCVVHRNESVTESGELREFLWWR